jgi:dolichol-phosphate mannosyltransferase
VSAWLDKLTWDWWVAVGALGQAVFFSRFMVQWIASERRGVSHMPRSFWWLSIVGSLVLLVYGVARHDPVFILAYLFNCVPYARNLMLPTEADQAAAPAPLPNPLSVAAAPVRSRAAGRRTLSVVVPAFCEEGNLRPLHDEVARALEGTGVDWELVLVDDCSTDGTAAIGRALAEEDPRVRFVELSRRCGQTGAMAVGLREASGELVATLDADLQNDPADLPRLLARLEGMLGTPPVDAVCGWRRQRGDGDGLVRRVSSRVANAVRDWGTGDRIHDSGCCFRLFRRECVADLQLFDGMHRFMPTLIRAQGFVVEEMPINHRPRVAGRTKYGVWNRIFKATRDLFAVRWMLRRWLRPAVVRRTGQGLALARPEDTPAA